MIIDIMKLLDIDKKQREYYETELKESLQKNIKERLYFTDGCRGVSSIKASDRDGYETAIVSEFSQKAIVVEAYDTIEEMNEGHIFWANMLKDKKLKEMYALQNVIGVDMDTFKSFLFKNYDELVESNKQPK